MKDINPYIVITKHIDYVEPTDQYQQFVFKIVADRNIFDIFSKYNIQIVQTEQITNQLTFIRPIDIKTEEELETWRSLMTHVEETYFKLKETIPVYRIVDYILPYSIKCEFDIVISQSFLCSLFEKIYINLGIMSMEMMPENDSNALRIVLSLLDKLNTLFPDIFGWNYDKYEIIREAFINGGHEYCVVL